MAEKEKLFLLRETEVRPNNLKYPHRYLMEFGYNKAETEKNFLNIHNDDGVGFTDQYKELTRDFYLNF
jgi:tRNA1(Val) A37 N6-methylase TrmN6